MSILYYNTRLTGLYPVSLNICINQQYHIMTYFVKRFAMWITNVRLLNQIFYKCHQKPYHS